MALLLLILPLSATSVLLLCYFYYFTPLQLLTLEFMVLAATITLLLPLPGAPEKVGLVSAKAPQVKVKVKGILRSFEGSERKVAFEGGAWGSDWGSPKTDNI